MKGTASLNSYDDYSVVSSIRADHMSFQQGGRRISDLNVAGTAVMDPHAIALNDFSPVVLGALWHGKTSALQQTFLEEMQLRAKRLAKS